MERPFLRGTESPIFEGSASFVNVERRTGKSGQRAWTGMRNTGTNEPQRAVFSMAHPPVTTVTDCTFDMGDTSFVNMVRRVRKKTLLEPGDTK
jgi:hypothetical protein